MALGPVGVRERDSGYESRRELEYPCISSRIFFIEVLSGENLIVCWFKIRMMGSRMRLGHTCRAMNTNQLAPVLESDELTNWNDINLTT